MVVYYACGMAAVNSPLKPDAMVMCGLTDEMTYIYTKPIDIIMARHILFCFNN